MSNPNKKVPSSSPDSTAPTTGPVTSARPTPGERGADRRAKAAAARRAEVRRRRRRRVATQVGAGAAAVAVVLGGTVAVLSGRDDGVSGADVPPGLTEDGAVAFGAEDAAVTVQVVEDLQCPACRAFEAAAGDLLDEYAAGDQVRVEYRTIAFLDRASTTRYSSRALNAAACTLADGPEVWKATHDTLYEAQPAEGGTGLTDEDLRQIALDAGAAEERVSSCIAEESYRDWAQATTQAAGDDGVTATPTVFVNGEVLPQPTVDSLRAAVEAAAS